MISIDYINSGHTILFDDSNYCGEFLDYLKESEKDIASILVSHKINMSKVLMESSIMDYDYNNYNDFFENENKNFIQKIGASIIAMVKKFNEMINKAIQKIKDISFRFKSNDKKMKELIKKHPELGKEKIKILCDEGALDFSDMTSLSKLDKAFDDILEMSKKANVDPKSLKGRWEAAKEKYLGKDYKKEGKVKTIVMVVSAVTLLAGIGTAIYKSRKEAGQAIDENQRRCDELYKNIEKDVSNNEDDFNINNQGITRFKLSMFWESRGLHSKAIGRHVSALDKLQIRIANAIDSFVDKHGDKGNAKRFDIKDAGERLEKRKVNDSAANERGKLIAQSSKEGQEALKKIEQTRKDVNSKLTEDEIEKARKLSKAQAIGKAAGEEESYSSKRVQQQAEDQAIGKAAGEEKSYNSDDAQTRAFHNEYGKRLGARMFDIDYSKPQNNSNGGDHGAAARRLGEQQKNNNGKGKGNKPQNNKNNPPHKNNNGKGKGNNPKRR